MKRMANSFLATLYLSLLMAFFPVAAQSQINRAKLDRFVTERTAQSKRLKLEVIRRAESMGIPVRKTLKSVAVVELKKFVNGRPLYYTTDNLNAADTVSADEVWPGGGLGVSLDGWGQVLGIWDGGSVRDTHQELNGRVTNIDVTGFNNHATHVAGTMIGAGVFSRARGMSFAGSLRSYDFNNDEVEMAAEQLFADPIKVSNHSYSFISGWIYDFFGDGRWVWFGDVAVSSNEDWIFGFYDQSSRDWDQIAYDSPNYLMVKSVGNDRNDLGSGKHWHLDNGTFVLSSDTHPPDGGESGYDTIAGGSASAKNILTIGAVEDILGGYGSPGDIVMSSFSGWGPTDDGRIKPDLVANGINLLSSVASSDTAYANASGTSMSSPNTSGSLGLLYQHAIDLYGADLRASTIKALVLHTADEAGLRPGPDYVYGWGLLNVESAAQLMTDEADSAGNHIRELNLDNGTTPVINFESDGSRPFRATIAWTDPPGAPPDGSVPDPPDLMLVNDIDIRVVDPDGVIHYPWILDPANPEMVAAQGDNFRDTVEQVVIDAPVAGTYTVEISHKGILDGGIPQPVSLIVSGNIGSAGFQVINFNDFSLGSYGGPQDTTGVVNVESGGTTLRLVGNRWQQIELNYTITPDTVLEFDFQSGAEGEIHGIGFDTDLNISSDRAFQLYGIQNWGIQDFNTYPGGVGIRHYRIFVGNYYIGFMPYLFFTMDHDVTNPTGESVFSNIQVYEDTGSNPPTITSTPSTTATVGIAYAYDVDGKVEATGSAPITFSLGSGPTGMSVSGSGVVSWTPVTGQEGIHTVEITATNNVGSDTQAFSITVSEAPVVPPINFNDFSLGSYGGPQDTTGVVNVESGGTTLRLVGNRWQQIELNYTITPDTVLEFDFQSGAEGEIHGIGFDTDLNISSDRAFQLYGIQNWGIQDFNTYPGGVGIRHYRIFVGNYYIGFMPYLFFTMDHDVTNPTGESVFSNIQVYEDTD